MTNVTPLRAVSFIGAAAYEVLQRLVNHEAEQALLGAILVNGRAYEAVCDSLTPDEFAHPLHGRIFAAVGTLAGAGRVADAVTLAHYFAGEDAAFGGSPAGYIHSLVVCAVSIRNAASYAQTIRDLARRRALVLAADATLADAANPSPSRDALAVLDDAEQRLHDLAQGAATAAAPQPLATIMPRTIGAIEAAYQRAAGGGSGALVVDTGIAALDRIIRGMGAGDLCVLAGRPAMGKTACAGTVAANAAASGKVVAFFSLEMTAEQLAMRWIAGRTGIATTKQRHGELDALDWPALVEARDYLAQLPIHVDDQPRLGAGQIRQRARAIRRRHGLDLVVIDHLQLMRQGGRQENRRTEVGDITGSLKAMAKELAVPVLLVSQLNRALESRDDKRPNMADLKESGDIEQDADIIMFVHRDSYYLERARPKRGAHQTEEAFAGATAAWQDRCDEAEGRAEIIVAKNRQGRTGMASVAWDATRQRFETLTGGGW